MVFPVKMPPDNSTGFTDFDINNNPPSAFKHAWEILLFWLVQLHHKNFIEPLLDKIKSY